ncbi:hypothetical protein ACWGDT_05850 [Streptomyces avermitilis]
MTRTHLQEAASATPCGPPRPRLLRPPHLAAADHGRHPASECGDTRILAPGGDGTAVEHLIEQAGRSYRYRLPSAPCPYGTTKPSPPVHENPEPADTLVTWDSTPQPDGSDEETAAVITGVLEAGLDALK